MYLEYHSVCPLIRIGTPPLSRKRVCPPSPGTKKEGGGAHSSACEGVGESQSNSDDWRKKNSIFSVLKTLFMNIFMGRRNIELVLL
jgi:hypothetical protein